jgi:hypothetical protein
MASRYKKLLIDVFQFFPSCCWHYIVKVNASWGSFTFNSFPVAAKTYFYWTVRHYENSKVLSILSQLLQ